MLSLQMNFRLKLTLLSRFEKGCHVLCLFDILKRGSFPSYHLIWFGNIFVKKNSQIIRNTGVDSEDRV